MDTKKQTAVEWLFKKLWDTPKDKLEWYAILAQAKEIEKEQIVEAYDKGVKAGIGDYINTEWGRDSNELTAEKYYTQTYVSNRDHKTL